MFRRKQKQNQYGLFAVKKRKTSSYLAAGFLFVLLAVGIGVAVFNSPKPENNIADIPQAQASEIPGWWLKDYFGASVCEQDNCRPAADPDNDKLTNAQEFFYHSHPFKKDTNGNGLTDGEDVENNYDPGRPGKVTFEEAVSDDEVVGESILLDQDIKKVIQDLTSMEDVKAPLINEAELTITGENSKQGVIDYLNKTDEII